MRLAAVFISLAIFGAPGMAQDQDLVFITVNPCVIFDTRPGFGGDGAFAAEEERTFHIVGSTADFPGQGGTAAGCGVPAWSGGVSVAKAILINYVAIDPQGGGQLKAWATDKTEPAQGALVNYQALTPPMNRSNAVVTELRQAAEGSDIKVRARSAGTHVRGVILGYFTKEHITGVIAGTGLTGGGTQGTVTLGIADGGVGIQQLTGDGGSSTGKVLTSGGTIVNWEPPIAAPIGPTGPTGVTGDAGMQIHGPERPGFLVSTIDNTLNVGLFTSTVIGVDGFGLISHYDSTNDDLKVAHCSNLACTTATLSAIDTAGDVGAFNSLTIGSDGLGLIAYRDGTDSSLKVAHCANVVCSAATISTLDGLTSNVGLHTSVTIGADGLGLISYLDTTNHDLKVAHCSNVFCTTATITMLDSTGSVGFYTSTAIGKDGLGLISYQDVSNLDLKVAHCSNIACTAATVSTVDSAGMVGSNTSLAVGSDGLGLIAYSDDGNDRLKIAHCVNVTCSSANITTVAGQIGEVNFLSLTIGADGQGLIAYQHNATSDLRVAHCRDLLCSDSSIATIDSAGSVGSYPSVTIGTDGLPLISYGGGIATNLKVAHLSNTMGIPFYRRR